MLSNKSHFTREYEPLRATFDSDYNTGVPFAMSNSGVNIPCTMKVCKQTYSWGPQGTDRQD